MRKSTLRWEKVTSGGGGGLKFTKMKQLNVFCIWTPTYELKRRKMRSCSCRTRGHWNPVTEPLEFLEEKDDEGDEIEALAVVFTRVLGPIRPFAAGHSRKALVAKAARRPAPEVAQRAAEVVDEVAAGGAAEVEGAATAGRRLDAEEEYRIEHEQEHHELRLLAFRNFAFRDYDKRRSV